MFKIINQLWFNQTNYSFDINELKLDSTKSLNIQLDEVYTEIKQLHHDNVEFVQALDKAHEGGKFLLDIAPLYDYDQCTQGNGYWTFAKLVIKFGKIIQLTTKNGQFKQDHALKVFDVLNLGLSLCHKIKKNEHFQSNAHDNNHNNGQLHSSTKTPVVEMENLFASNLDIADLLPLIKTLKTNLVCLHAYYGSCWLSPCIVGIMQFVSNFMAIYSSQWKTLKLYNWISRHYRGHMFTNMSQNVNIDCLKSMWNMTKYQLIRNFLEMYNPVPVYSKNIYVPRQKRWVVSDTEPRVYDMQQVCNSSIFEKKLSKSSVRCLLLQSFESMNNNHQIDNKPVLFHIHGGGFISQSPECHQTYLNQWIQKLTNVAIISVDYSLSPEAAYPEALQEVLDCYLWLISNEPKVKQTLGFNVGKIVLCGDSAGGNLSMALLLALRNMEKSIEYNLSPPLSHDLRYPEAIFCFYTPFLLCTMISPSRLITSIDGLMPVGCLLSCLAAYVPQKVMDRWIDDKPYMNCNSNNIESTNRLSLTTIPLSVYNLIYKLTSLPLTVMYKLCDTLIIRRQVPWYKQPEVVLKRSLYNMNQFLKNPFISPLLAENIDLDIPLYLFPLTYDMLLDDSIEMAKRWKGQVQIKVIDDLPHGFLNLIKFSEKAHEVSNQCAQHLVNVFADTVVE